MLRPDEIAVGSFPEAEGLTLMLPRDERDEPILISAVGGEKMAIYLGRHKYNACPCGDSTNWRGILVAGVSIELDLTSSFDAERDFGPLGSLIRGGTGLDIVTEAKDDHYITRRQHVGLLNNLPPSREGYSAGFTRWQIALGEGDTKRVLLAVDAAPPRSTVDVNV
jgi:hypothetical protein